MKKREMACFTLTLALGTALLSSCGRGDYTVTTYAPDKKITESAEAREDRLREEARRSEENLKPEPTTEPVTEPETEEVTEAPEPWADCPEEFREILRDAEDRSIPYVDGYSGQQSRLEWINSFSMEGNKFAEFLKEKREILHLDSLSDRDRDVMRMLLDITAYGVFDATKLSETPIVATGYDKDGKGNMENSDTKDGDSYARAIFASDDKYVYSYVMFIGRDKAGKETSYGVPITIEINGGYAGTVVDLQQFRKDGGVTPDNVTETLYLKKKPVYTTVELENTKDLSDLLFVYGKYVSEIVYPGEHPEEEDKQEEEQTTEQKSKSSGKSGTNSSGKNSGKSTGKSSNSGSGKSSGSSSGKKKTEKRKIDPDDLDIEGYYEDYKDEFESLEDAWDDLLDNPDMWEDYEY